MRTVVHPAGADLTLPNILYALGDPARLQIVEELAAERDPVTCQRFVIAGVAKSTQSHRLKLLREAGLIRMVPQGRQVLVSLRRDELNERFPGLLDMILQTNQRQ